MKHGQCSFYLWFILAWATSVLCDVPTNCTYEETLGKWELILGQSTFGNDINCTKAFTIKNVLRVELLFPNNVVDQYGNIGTWSMVYNQGFEIILNQRRYFAFQYYENVTPTKTVSYCYKTFNGWTHDVLKNNVFPPTNWGCYKGNKLQKKNSLKISQQIDLTRPHYSQVYGTSEAFVKEINQQQSSWKAGAYEQYQNFTIRDMIMRSGGLKRFARVHPSVPSTEAIELVSNFPTEFDWRNVNGQNFVSPIRNQGTCGSCYAFASMAMLEARVRVESGNAKQPVFSTQNVVSCSAYSQGCEGGMAYLISGMYAQDFGVISEESYPYIGNDTKCDRSKGGTRTYVSDYGYVGGFYGGCNEALMIAYLVKQGPIAVSIEVYDDLFAYKGGIYHHTGLRYKFNPFEINNHVVLIVGYGVENGEKFWIVKNSWGTTWGEDGFFRIRRGTDEIAIESIAVYAKPYVPK
ncbi:dipeptidyl peptidase 1-like [Hydractinia symbiolongicarpus]|uniref:dipeptidyl peptidase 1-like n=1 Tax=Hydractinia symbiolongicarpus TaxID=13093 RepID=UPI00254AEC53|nr:dipeptidyl peptidase 1-like [Hydractinia symbiolongicarpus]